MLNFVSTERDTYPEPAAATALSTLGRPAARTIEEKKKNGIFYTPHAAARILANWAIQRRTDRVLEPSFGGCGFLAAARDRLYAVGSQTPAEYLFGCDVDLAAFGFLTNLFAGNLPQRHFVQADFLALTPAELGEAAFDTVIGNPPYVSLHNMSEEQRIAARRVAEASGVALSRKASLWAYFVIHSLSFLKSGGRMAWILPGSFLHADYSVALRDKLSNTFARTLAVQLEQRLFLEEGTEENSVVLLCDGYRCGTKSDGLRLTCVSDIAALQAIIDSWAAGDAIGEIWADRTRYALFSSEMRELWNVLSERASKKLGDYITFRIGIVTGANKFFILNDESIETHQLPPEVLRPIVGKFAHCRGIILHDNDFVSLREQGARCILFDASGQRNQSQSVQRYLDTYDEGSLEKNATFKKRGRWDQPDDGLIPHGFFSAMQADGPTLVLNASSASCSNTVYRVWFHSIDDQCDRKLIAVSLQSTYSQLSAEIEGRSYGSGGLKLEPSEAARVRLAVPRELPPSVINQAFAEIDAKLRANDREGARSAADELLSNSGVFDENELALLQAELARVRHSRRHSRRKQ